MSALVYGEMPEEFRNAFKRGVDGRYYCTNQSALARLCGVHKTSIEDLLYALRDSVEGKRLPSYLEGLRGFDYWLSGKLDEVQCYCIIKYYATDSKAANDTAKTHLDMMGLYGFHGLLNRLLGVSENTIPGRYEEVIEMFEFEKQNKHILEDKTVYGIVEILDKEYPGLSGTQKVRIIMEFKSRVRGTISKKYEFPRAKVKTNRPIGSEWVRSTRNVTGMTMDLIYQLRGAAEWEIATGRK